MVFYSVSTCQIISFLWCEFVIISSFYHCLYNFLQDSPMPRLWDTISNLYMIAATSNSSTTIKWYHLVTKQWYQMISMSQDFYCKDMLNLSYISKFNNIYPRWRTIIKYVLLQDEGFKNLGFIISSFIFECMDDLAKSWYSQQHECAR